MLTLIIIIIWFDNLIRLKTTQRPQTLPCPMKTSSVSVDELLACLLSSRLVGGLSAVITFGPSDWWWWTISDVYVRATMVVHDSPVCDTIFCCFCSHIWHKYWTNFWQEHYIPQTPAPQSPYYLLEKGANLTFATFPLIERWILLTDKIPLPNPTLPPHITKIPSYKSQLHSCLLNFTVVFCPVPWDTKL